MDLSVLEKRVEGFGHDLGEIRSLLGKLPDSEELERLTRAANDLAGINTEIRKWEAQNRADTERQEAFEKRFDEFMQEMYGKADGLETRVDSLVMGGEAQRDGKFSADRKEHLAALVHFARSGRTGPAAEFMERQSIQEIEKRALNEGDLPSGGFLLDAVIEREIQKNVVDMSPVMQVARIIPITAANEYKTRKRTGRPTFHWVGESEVPGESNAKYGMFTIDVHMGGVDTVASLPLLQDVSYIESEMAIDAAEEIERGLNYAFLNGDGVEKPYGLLQDPDITWTAGVDTTDHLLQGDDFYTLLAGNDSVTSGLKGAYRGNSTFAFSSAILGKVLKLKDNTDNYLWQPRLADGPLSSIAGRPYVNFEDMATDGTLNNKVLLLGDFQKGYRIIQRMGMWLIRDEVTQKPDVEFSWYVRYGGRVFKAEAIKGIKCG